MYVAYYGRPGDPDGVDYWAGELDDNGGNISVIVDSFGNSQEYIDNYGEPNSDQLVTTLFQQILGRDADPEGLRFYVGLLDSGAKSLASIALDIANGVQGEDIDTLANKVVAAQYITAAVANTRGPYGQDQLTFVKQLLLSISHDADTLDAAYTEFNAFYYEEQIAADDVVPNYSIITTLDVVASRIDFPGDSDVYSIQLKSGTEYIFDVTSDDGGLREPWLGVSSPGSSWLATGDNQGADTKMIFTPEATGLYYLSVLSSDSTETGAYSLTTDWVGNDLIEDDSSSEESLLPGNSISSHIDFTGDEDWIYVELTAGTEYTFHLLGVDSGAGSLADPALSLYDESGSFLIEDDDGGAGLGSKLGYTPNSTHGYFLVAAGSGTGTYTLTTTAKEQFTTTPLTVTFDDPEGQLEPYLSEIEINILAAWKNWDVYIDAHAGAEIEVVVTAFVEIGDTATALARAGSLHAEWLADGISRPGVAHELITGEDPNGSEYDARIQINLYHLQEEGYFDFSPDGYTPPQQVSFEDVMQHELGHALGFNGWFDDSGNVSIYETLLDPEKSEFTGEHAITTNGEPVALGLDFLGHLSKEVHPNASMTEGTERGGVNEITDIEIAILADIGLPIHEDYLFA